MKVLLYFFLILMLMPKHLHVVEHLHVVGVDRECGFVIILCDYFFFMVGTHYKKDFLVRSCLEERELCIDERRDERS